MTTESRAVAGFDAGRGDPDRRVVESKIADSRVPESRVTDSQMTDSQVTESKVTDNQVTDNQVTDSQVTDSLSGGFADTPVQSARAFRAVLEAMAQPGTIRIVAGALPPAPLSLAAGVVLLTLADATTTLHLAGAADCGPVRDWVAFHIGAPIVAAPDAELAVGRWDALQPVARFRIGQPDYPDRSATLIVEVDRLTNHGPALTGPGIETATWLNLPETAAFRANRARFPLGFDTILSSGDRIAALPRSTRVEAI